MAGMVGDTELLGKHRCDHDRCPNPAHEAIGNGATIKDLAQMRSLLCRQPVRATRRMSFQEPVHTIPLPVAEPDRYIGTDGLDRKSTRLNSSHRCISYAVFCLKKKKTKHNLK